jgi:hypothetical protein
MSKTQAVEVRGRLRRKASPTVAEKELGERSPWRLVRGGAALYRSYKFPNPSVAANFSQLVVGLAAHTGLPLFVRLCDASVILTLRGSGGRSVSSLAGELFDRIASLS